jgi:hypothetical protein
MPYSIKAISGLAVSERRSVVFLLSNEHSLNAESRFNAMNEPNEPRSNQQRTVLSRMDYWISGGHNDRWFHGWPNHPDYANCFTFKWNYRNVDQRFYGFLCNPRSKTNPRFQLCVLHSHGEKVQWNTEPGFLELTVRLSKTPDVAKAIEESFSDIDKED